MKRVLRAGSAKDPNSPELQGSGLPIGDEADVLSLEECRKLIGKGCDLSPGELAMLRRQAYAMADVVCAAFARKKANGREGMARVVPAIEAPLASSVVQ